MKIKLFGLFIAFCSVAAGWVLHSDIEQQERFEKSGKKTQATVTSVEKYVDYSHPKFIPITFPVAVDYNYTVNGVEYSGRSSVFQGKWKKGDPIEIEYLEDQPEINLDIPHIHDVSTIRILRDVCIAIAAIGTGLLFWPVKKPKDNEEQIDWAEKERHESGN